MYKLTTEVVAMVSVHVVVVCKRQRNEFKFRPQESHSRQQLLLSQDYFLTNGQNYSSSLIRKPTSRTSTRVTKKVAPVQTVKNSTGRIFGKTDGAKN